MKITTTLAVAVGLAALAGCNQTAKEQTADNIEANADVVAENIEANADAVADNIVANADNAADAVRDGAAVNTTNAQ
jgi:anti-sigma factor ChrR (cupin superfamily)